MAAQRACRDHPTVLASVACASCRRPLCDACFRFRAAGDPACARCAYEIVTRPKRRRSLATAFALTSWAALAWAARHFGVHPGELYLFVGGGVVGLLVAIAIALPTFTAESKSVERRDDEEPPVETVVMENAGSPFRARARRVVLAASPRVSGAATALIVGLSLVGAAVLLPASVHWPRWVEAEVVLAAWWLIVGTTLVVLLYRGFRLKDDWVYFAPWETPPGSTEGGGRAKATKPKGGGGCSPSGLDGCVPDGCDGCGDIGDAGEGIIVVVVVAVALAITFGAMWLFAEFGLPVIFLLMYTLIHRAIGRVANDRHGCEANLLKSLGYGALWATVYVVPLAAVTWALHRFVPALR
jgi:hypothetical protein